MAEVLSTSEVRTSPLVAASAAEVRRLFRECDDAQLHYHSLGHTEDVVEAADRIAALSDYAPEDHEALLVAAWWHDTGMLTCGDPPVGHEKVSADLAEHFLRGQGAGDERVALVRDLILATDYNREPTTELERAMRDADLSGLGRPEYRDRLKRLRKEWDAQGRLKTETRVEWLEENLAFFDRHTFHTAAAQRLYGKQKEVNREIIEKRHKKRVKKAKKNSEKSSKTVLQAEKSAQMMVKTTLRNNIDLTAIADGKANIMLSINAVIITLGMPLLAAYIPEFNYLLLPGICLLITCIATITFATLATRPVKTSGQTNLEQIHSGKTNLFFFGNYYKMQLSEYKEGMRHVFASQELLDNSVMNDLYWLGVALGEKFNRLRICYAVFLIGMVLTIIAFVAAFYWAGPLNEGIQVPDQIILPAGEAIGQ